MIINNFISWHHYLGKHLGTGFRPSMQSFWSQTDKLDKIAVIEMKFQPLKIFTAQVFYMQACILTHTCTYKDTYTNTHVHTYEYTHIHTYLLHTATYYTPQFCLRRIAWQNIRH